MRSFVVELRRRNPVLWKTGWLHIGLFLLTLVLMPFDDRLVTGVNPWIKPMKFSLSIAIYVWTAGWLLEYLRFRQRLWNILTWGISASMIVEILCIMTQAARGTTSHYNIATPLDGVIFSLMGIMIMVNTVLAGIMLYAFFRHETGLPPAYLWGIRLGIIVFLAGSAVGQHMIANFAHTVGGADGGPGLPFVNWSTRYGDLRIAHALGLHALQLLPFAGYISGRKFADARTARGGIFLFTALYLAIVVALYVQAVLGRPLIELG